MTTAAREATHSAAERLNGWQLDEFNKTIETVKQTPEAGKLTWRSRMTWDAGFGGDARPEEIEQLGEVIQRKFTLRSDHPPELLGENTGPTAVEILLSGLGACIMGRMRRTPPLTASASMGWTWSSRGQSISMASCSLPPRGRD
jgi:hypothetical protein